MPLQKSKEPHSSNPGRNYCLDLNSVCSGLETCSFLAVNWGFSDWGEKKKKKNLLNGALCPAAKRRRNSGACVPSSTLGRLPGTRRRTNTPAGSGDLINIDHWKYWSLIPSLGGGGSCEWAPGQAQGWFCTSSWTWRDVWFKPTVVVQPCLGRCLGGPLTKAHRKHWKKSG